jgi:beta-ribofuranosylaminobenzene 5'-phosphate synthase
MSKIEISVPARIHVSLLDMSDKGYRSNGGIGFFLDRLSTKVKVEVANNNDFIDNREIPTIKSFPTKTFLVWLNNYLKENDIAQKFKITITGNVPSHFGFGLSTSVRMACVEGVYVLIDKNKNRKTLIKQSHRGGTSGIGVHGYFTGGLVLDLGKNQNTKHIPSRLGESSQHLPLLLAQVPMPKWKIGVLIPYKIPSKTSIQEKEFFDKTCPIDILSVYKTTYDALFGVFASAKSKNFNQFCKAINNLQDTEWKKAEWLLYPELVKIKKRLCDFGVQAIGMSSLGPSLYFFSDNIDQIFTLIQESFLGEAEVLLTESNNIGRVIHNV